MLKNKKKAANGAEAPKQPAKAVVADKKTASSPKQAKAVAPTKNTITNTTEKPEKKTTEKKTTAKKATKPAVPTEQTTPAPTTTKAATQKKAKTETSEAKIKPKKVKAQEEKGPSEEGKSAAKKPKKQSVAVPVSAASTQAPSTTPIVAAVTPEYRLGDLSALFSPNLEKDVFGAVLDAPKQAAEAQLLRAASAATTTGKNKRKKSRPGGLAVSTERPAGGSEEKTEEMKAEEGLLPNPEKIKKSLERQRAFAKGADHHAEDERLPRTVFVGNIPVKVGVKVVTKEFKQYGEVESVRFRSFGQGDPKLSKRAAFATKTFHEDRDSCNAYVVFKTEEAAQKALSHNGKLLEGNILRVDTAVAKKADKNLSVFVGNLPFNAKENDLREMFADSGTIENVRIVRDKTTGIGKGVAFILFHDHEAVRKALSYDQSSFGDRKLRVFKAVDRPKPSASASASSSSFAAALATAKKSTLKKAVKASSTKKSGEAWQGEQAHQPTAASINKKRKHTLRGRKFKKVNDGEGGNKRPKNSSKKFRKENDKKHTKKSSD